MYLLLWPRIGSYGYEVVQPPEPHDWKWKPAAASILRPAEHSPAALRQE